jgi:hypothetical protein
MPTLIEHFGFWPLVAQRLARMAEAPNQSLPFRQAQGPELAEGQPTTGRLENYEGEIRK